MSEPGTSEDGFQLDAAGTDLHAEPDLQNTLDEKTTDDILDEGYSPPERPLGLDAHGTTVTEQREGMTLDQRLAIEEPDVWDVPDEGDGLGDTTDTDGELLDDQVGGVRAGRLVAPDEGAHTDVEKDAVAYDVGIDGGAAGAEEAAMHVVSEDDL
jgi:hypothetical protein